jgi:hypothetical protein
MKPGRPTCISPHAARMWVDDQTGDMPSTSLQDVAKDTPPPLSGFSKCESRFVV